MKPLASILLIVLAISLSAAQSGRETSGGATKANKRTPQPVPTASPTPGPPDTSDSGEPEVEIIKVETQLITVPVRVLDKRGRFVGGLARENFKIFEDGVEQQIAHFSSEKEPFTVALVLDMSYSTKFKINEIQSAAIAFIDQLGPSDRVMVVSFDQDVHMMCEATSDRNAIYRAIRSTKISTGTSLYEAVDLVVNDRLKQIRGRKAMIIFTDGVDTSSMRTNDLQNLSDVLELDAVIYPIRYDTFADVQAMKDQPVFDPSVIKSPIPSKDPSRNPLPIPIQVIGRPSDRGTTAEDYRRAQEYLDQLALRTAGRLYEANTTVNLASAFTKIASELREYYSLGFYPQDDAQTGRLRRLKVRLDQPGLSVKARDSYVAGKRVTQRK